MKYRKAISIIGFLLPAGLMTTAALAADKTKTPAQNPAPAAAVNDGGAEKVNVENIKEKYWARGDESEMGVVQNRTYSKDRKWELGVFGGAILNDPFLNVNNYGLSLGYHFSEYFAVNALMWKANATGSAALKTFEETKGGETNYNKPKSYTGGEAVGSFLYGKLSVAGKSIIYYDMHLLGGLGMTNTENGTYATPHVGVGQQVYLGKNVSLRLDYRLMYYHEDIKERVITAHLGETVGSRNNFSNVITIGASFMFGGPSEQKVSK
jgi:outer membrane beta-barrel protein